MLEARNVQIYLASIKAEHIGVRPSLPSIHRKVCTDKGSQIVAWSGCESWGAIVIRMNSLVESLDPILHMTLSIDGVASEGRGVMAKSSDGARVLGLLPHFPSNPQRKSLVSKESADKKLPEESMY